MRTRHAIYFIILMALCFSCGSESTNGISYPAKYEYFDTEYPTEYRIYVQDTNSDFVEINRMGSTYEEIIDILLNDDLDTAVFEGIDEEFGQLFSFELLSDTSMILSTYDNGVAVETATNYEIIDDILEIEGLNFASPDFKINYNDLEDEFNLVFSLELPSRYDSLRNIRIRQPNIQHFGDVEFGDYDEILSRFDYDYIDTIAIGFGHLVWPRL